MEADEFMQRAGKLAGWAARTGYTLGKRVPGADSAERSLRNLEQKALTELHKRMESASNRRLMELTDLPTVPENPVVRGDGADHGTNGSGTAGTGSGSTGSGARSASTAVALPLPHDPLRAGMAALLNRSTLMNRDAARDYLYASMLRQLTPDEARIISTLSDGTDYPVVDIAEKRTGRVLLRNASTVGKTAGVSATEYVPVYVTRLIGFGLAELEAEKTEMTTQYEILMTDETVRKAEDLPNAPRSCAARCGSRRSA
ncbi:Abi-alpha family protein [Saccharomonospora sp. CUA-673]|uniref:Abi-alpha family protein n=1 Tax=Saccharomonospora sp. CUA-673 TaxID=1904969 RepID=UPI002101B917|nr:Abi-alpha family protein [Saccharomonospora sp. CUA-673]